jgi:hypothetical protein
MRPPYFQLRAWYLPATCVLAWALPGMVQQARGSCGDWLAHPASLVPGDLPGPTGDQATTPVSRWPGCQGAQCGKSLPPVSLPNQRLTVPSHELAAVLAAIIEEGTTKSANAGINGNDHPLSGYFSRIDRPPRA